MRPAKFPLILLALSACTAAAIAGSSCGGDTPGGGGTGGNACGTGCDAGDDGSPIGDADATANDDAGDAAIEDAKDDTADAEAGDDDAGDAGDAGDGADAGPTCTQEDPTCPGALTCCDGACVDLHADPLHCGSCALACTGSQFCTGAACAPVLLASVCANARATVSFDSYTADNVAGVQIGNALTMHCDPPVTVQPLDQSSPDLLDQATYRPILGSGNTLVAGGGAFGQHALAYLDNKGLSPLYATLGPTGNLLLVRRLDGMTLVDAPPASLTDNHDYFVCSMTVEPTSGTLVLAVFGLMAKGTTAGAWYWQNVMAPALPDQGSRWYVYEWTDTNADAAPDANDTFALVAKGN